MPGIITPAKDKTRLSKAAKKHIPRWMQDRKPKKSGPLAKQVTTFVDSQIRLVDAERQYVLDEARKRLSGIPAHKLQSMGLALVGMRVTDTQEWLNNNALMTLEPDSNQALPRHVLRPGDVVEVDESAADRTMEIYEGEDNTYLSAVIVSISNSRVVLAMKRGEEELPGQWNGYVTVKKLINDTPFIRILNLLCDLDEYAKSRPHLHKTLICGQPPTFSDERPGNRALFNNRLDKWQRDAVKRCVQANDLAIIHGPPGTGKTHTLVEVIKQLVLRKNQRVLVCGPSNVSVDNVVERLGKSGTMPIVRVGHPARITNAASKFGIDYLTKHGYPPDWKHRLNNRLTQELVLQTQDKEMEGRDAHTKLMKMVLKKEKNKRNANQYLSQASVVLSTLSGAASSIMARNTTKFDVVIIDEATQAMEAECWMAALKAPKLILAGDHHQLPPTILSMGDRQYQKEVNGENKALELTMFERMCKLSGQQEFRRVLNTQYRMNHHIMRVSSSQLYKGKLVAHISVKYHVLSGLPNIADLPGVTDKPFVFINTAGASILESRERSSGKGLSSDDDDDIPGSKSMVNEGEAKLVFDHLDKLIASGVSTKDVVLISPYSGQVRMMSQMAKRGNYPDLEIGSVDGLQGREKEVVILSMVRSNKNGQIGFLRDYRRINVAITRARRHLCVIADAQTISKGSRFLRALFAHMRTKAVAEVKLNK